MQHEAGESPGVERLPKVQKVDTDESERNLLAGRQSLDDNLNVVDPSIPALTPLPPKVNSPAKQPDLTGVGHDPSSLVPIQLPAPASPPISPTCTQRQQHAAPNPIAAPCIRKQEEDQDAPKGPPPQASVDILSSRDSESEEEEEDDESEEEEEDGEEGVVKLWRAQDAATPAEDAAPMEDAATGQPQTEPQGAKVLLPAGDQSPDRGSESEEEEDEKEEEEEGERAQPSGVAVGRGPEGAAQEAGEFEAHTPSADYSLDAPGGSPPPEEDGTAAAASPEKMEEEMEYSPGEWQQIEDAIAATVAPDEEAASDATGPPEPVEEAAAEEKDAADPSTQPTHNLLQDPPRTCLTPLRISLILIIFQYPPDAANHIDLHNVKAVRTFVAPPRNTP